MREPPRFSGVMPANLLPFTADLAIDEPAFRKHLRWLADTRGVTGIVANGHAAEVSSLSRDRECAPALLARERGDVGGVTVGNDPGDTAGVGEPAQVFPERGLVDREVGRERQEARGHDPRELHHGDTSPVISLAGTTRPDARPMISEWRGAATVRVRVTRVRDSGAGPGPSYRHLRR